ncbi:MAG: hypothetical protein ACE5JX_08785 [Acidobacteriota bacterium]
MSLVRICDFSRRRLGQSVWRVSLALVLPGSVQASSQGQVGADLLLHPGRPQLRSSGTELDPVAAFRKIQKLNLRQSERLVKKKLGENYFTRRILPLTLTNLFRLVIPHRSGDLTLRATGSFLDGTVNGLMAAERKRLKKWALKMFPSLPFLGSLLPELVDSPRLLFSRGLHQYRFSFRNRMTPHYRLGPMRLSGGTEMRFIRGKWSRTTLADFRFSQGEKSYLLGVAGDRVKLNVGLKHLRANLLWNPRGLRFSLQLTF